MDITRTLTDPGRWIDPSIFEKRGTVLLESIATDDDNAFSYLFHDPSAVIQCFSASMVPTGIDQLEEAVSKGMHAAGFIGYEAGMGWDTRGREYISTGFPLLWFGLYDRVQRFDTSPPLPAPKYPYEPVQPCLDLSSRDYEERVGRILRHIGDGETYQVNFTARTAFRWRHGAWQLYLRLRRSQPVPYGAFVNCGRFSLVSLSPELYLRKRGNALSTRPMKGTAARGSDPESDAANANWLQTDEKNRAENLMILDLMRNDLGRVAETGTVQVFDPFRIEPYSGLFQMTSGVMCLVNKGLRLCDLFEATFPPGSVTGAPKVNTMRIISDLETTPRNSYTGAIGAIHPGSDLTLNVAIRTVTCTPSGRCEMGVGSGIVADSDPSEEFSEVSLKADFLDFSPSDRVDLFETVLLQEDGTLVWFEEHLDRMEDSAAILGFPFSAKQARSIVEQKISGTSGRPAVVRLVITRTGDISVDVIPLEASGETRKRAVLSRHRIDPENAIIFHKTTDRKTYDLELAEARKRGFYEVLYTNIAGNLTEGAFTNLFILADSGWTTPSVRCGLLPGIWRGKYLGSTSGTETMLKAADLASARRVVVGNSVRGGVDVDEIVDPEGTVIFRKRTPPENT